MCGARRGDVLRDEGTLVDDGEGGGVIEYVGEDGRLVEKVLPSMILEFT